MSRAYDWIIGFSDPMRINLDTGMPEQSERCLKAHYVEPGHGKHLHVVDEKGEVIGVFNDWLYFYRQDLVDNT